MTTLYLCLIFAVYPLFIKDGLFALQKAKLSFFIPISIIYIVYSLIHQKKWKFRPLDGYVLAFFASLCISTLFSRSWMDSLIGNHGRYHGLFLMSIYTLLYFCLSRSTYRQDILIKSMVFGVIISSTLGFLNVLGIDPLQIYPRISMNQRQFFISTLGNLDFYGAYQVLMLGYFLSLKGNLITIIGIIFSSIGLASSNVDGAIVALCVYVLIALYKGVNQDFLIRLFIFLTSVYLSLQILLRFGSLYEYSSLYQLLGNGFVYLLLVVTLFIINLLSQKTIRMVIILLILSIILLSILLSIIFKDVPILKILEIFRFNEAWGSHRGLLYQLGFEHYKDLNILEKIFGTGLETVYLLTANQSLMGGVLIDNYHSVYLQLLVTCGLFGLSTYLIMLYAFMKKYGCLFWIIFIVVDLVGIWQVASTPFAFIMLFIIGKRYEINLS